MVVSSQAPNLADPPPPHQPDQAREYLRLLGGSYKKHGDATFENGIYPQKEEDLYIGAYGNALLLGTTALSEDATRTTTPRHVQIANALLPNSRALIIVLHSVVDLFAFAWYENGKLLRSRAGSADDGTFHDHGPPLPIELDLKRRYEKQLEESIDGEELVMELSREFLGRRIDELDASTLPMELFKRSPRWKFW